jgi:hypothetical protein
MNRIIFIAALFPLLAVAQSTLPKQPPQYVVVHKDARIDALVRKQAEVNDATIKLTKRSDKGFRIQVINTNDRNLAFSIKSKLLQLYPDQKVYMSYAAPFYKLRFGNFSKKEDADNYKKELSKTFTQPMYIVADQVEIKPMTEEEYLAEKQKAATSKN